ncbi:uncharacterized protein L201_005059 [Kwoniella dendrophila CBS 6074]|uniref:NADH:flavin oxidoreductase/NADH oxidase N-terminal domain-containing protein n=1 Tax=Kwoniella dendrophila CBS 6074 TaxID=1295534 RepID=A0AAX4JY48_9TREE
MTIQASKLFEPVKVGSLDLKHRVVLAPLTRYRAEKDTGVPGEHFLMYYSQRASDGGLLITEATFISENARGYDSVPCIFNKNQIEGWKKITDAVHAKGGKIVCQLWHLGRVANPEVSPIIYAASDIPDPETPYPSPKLHVMTEEDIDRTVDEYVHAAKSAVEAGFDGVELHGANGYLIDQFLQPVSNQRTDSYGGSLENRFKFPLRVLNSVCEAIGAERVGIKQTPFGKFQGMRGDYKPLDTFIPWTKTIIENQPNLAYIHTVDNKTHVIFDVPPEERNQQDNIDEIRNVVHKNGNGSDPLKHADETDDLIAFGRYFISNPDLPNRLKNGYPLKKYERDTFYSSGPKGYIDFHEYQAVHQDEAANPDHV